MHPLKHNLNPLTSLVNNENACHLTEAAQCLKFNNHLASSRDARKAIFDKQCLWYCRDSEKNPRLKPGCVAGSSNPEDYDFGLEHVDVEEYRRLANILYSSFCSVWSVDRLTSYLVKLIDYIPASLKQGDIP